MSLMNMEECELLGDSKYRAYISQVEKALKNFEYTSEWADLISALGKLNKVLMNHVKYPVIPKRVTIGKRLAQCLHPALPSGVHNKTLETYDIIFKCIGTPRLAQDLFTYSAGLFPLLSYAAMNVRPSLLALYETHFVPLGKHVKPALTGILLGILPGLEEGSEHSERTTNLLEEFCEAAEPSYFYGCLWECVLNSPSIRLAAINFVLSHFNRKQSMEDQLHLMGTNIDLLVESLCSSVQDTSVLVQRSALDLLVLGFPMHNSQLTQPDMIKIITAAIKVVLRRDMSLNRRLYAWLLGTDANGQPIPVAGVQIPDVSKRRDSISTCSEPEMDFFNMYSKEYLIIGVKNCILESSGFEPLADGKPANLRPFRILISLLDKPEIGSAILEDILVEVFRCMYRECMYVSGSSQKPVTNGRGVPISNCDSAASQLARYAGFSSKSRGCQEVKVQTKEEKSVTTEIIKTANLLFGAFEPYYMWDFLGRTFERVCLNCEQCRQGTMGTGELCVGELCQLMDFLLDKVSVEAYREIQTEHLPELLKLIISSLSMACEKLTEPELTAGLKLCSKILGRVQPCITPIGDSDPDTTSLKNSPFHWVARFGNEKDDGPTTESDVFISADDDTGGDIQDIADDMAGNDTRSMRGEAALNIKYREEDAESFNEFVQYAESESKGKSQEEDGTGKSQQEENKLPQLKFVSPRRVTVRQASTESAPQSMMQTCVQSFHKLFATIVLNRIIKDPEIPPMLLSQLTTNTDHSSPFHGLQLFRVNSGGDISFSWTAGSGVKSQDGDRSQRGLRQLKLEQPVSVEMTQAFRYACQLLVDFSSFPMYCTNYHKVLQNTFNADGVDLPLWLQLLLTCACFVEDFGLQSCALSTVLDLIGLTETIKEEAESKVDQGQEGTGSSRHHSASEGTISVLIIPSLSKQNLLYLKEKTNFYKLLATSLWEYLGEEYPHCHGRAVDLLYQLHQLSPDPWICEDVIGDSLLADDKVTRIGAYKRFTNLWHLLRDKVPTQSQSRALRTFDRSMFVMLDSLQSDIHPCSAITQTWLSHTVQRGDIARILEPLLLILLHPDTARVSIQHVNIHKPHRVKLSSEGDDQSDPDMETKIYAISSEGGNIIYHVSNTGGRTISGRNSEELRTYALTSISDPASSSSPAATKTARTKMETELHFDKVNPSDLNLRVNPFGGSQNSLDRIIFDGFDLPIQRSPYPNLEKTKRLDMKTCKQEGIFFDDNEGDDKQGDGVCSSKNEEDKQVSQTDIKAESTPKNGLTIKNIADKNENRVSSEDLTDSSDSSDPKCITEENSVTRKEGDDSIKDGQDVTKIQDEHVREQTTEELVASLLDEMVDKVVSSDQESVYEEAVDAPPLMLSIPQENAGSDDIFKITSRMSESESLSETDLDAVGGGRIGGRHGEPQEEQESPSVHPLHTHILLYTQKFDAQRSLYALSCIKTILSTSPRLVTCAISTTSLSSTNSPNVGQLLNLLIRHRRSVFGKNFFHEVPSETASAFKNTMYIEILISVCLYFIRSYYPNLMMSKLAEQELNGNKEVQILSCEILTLLLSELINVAKESGKGFAEYIGDLLARCKVQKALLHCILASVYNSRKKTSTSEELHITEAIISFNEENMDVNTNETFQMKLLRLLLVIVILEDQIQKTKSDSDSLYSLPPEWDKNKGPLQPAMSVVRFLNARPVVYQGMLVSAVLSALKQQHLSHMHRHWVGMVTAAMPYMGRALSHIVVAVVNQLCRNMELLAQQYELGDLYKSTNYKPDKIPPDHMITLMEALTTILHYCLLDNSQQDISVGQSLFPSPGGIASERAATGHVFTNLKNVFNSNSASREPSPAKENNVTSSSSVLEARRYLLSILPRVVASLAVIWKAIHISEARWAASGHTQPCWTMGSPRAVKQCILEFVSPIAMHHSSNLMGAVAVVWNDRRQRPITTTKRETNPPPSDPPLDGSCMQRPKFFFRNGRAFLGEAMPPSRLRLVLPSACDDQMLLVQLIGAVRVLPMDSLIQTVKLVVKQPPPTAQDTLKKRTPLEVSMLQFFYACVQCTEGRQLVDSWPALLSLLKDGLQISLTPPGTFLLLAILNEFVQKIPMFEERKDQKDLQEICHKLLEACSEVAGASLEQTTFFRRNLAVKPGPQVDVTIQTDDTTTDQDTEVNPEPTMEVAGAVFESGHRQFSVQALVILAELTASLLDVVYRSEEKDRVLPLLTSILHNVFPYLKNHSPHNLPSFRACSQMLASFSSYQYTRKVWKKEALELLLDPTFFQMDEVCINYWRIIIDNLMTHDKTTFRDLLVRVPLAQSGALNLFSSKEAESENRAQLLKRLGFTIFCGDVDQYQRNMPDIQERLSDSLRMASAPAMQAQVFLTFRVMMLRISPQHLTSLWPTIITELVHVLQQIEQDLSPDTEDAKNQVTRLSSLDPASAVGAGFTGAMGAGWLRLYLAACKLLDLALLLPADILPQFQLYHWAFVGETGVGMDNDRRRFKDQFPSFVPHVTRIARLMSLRFGAGVVFPQARGRPLLTVQRVRSLKDLHSFFTTIASRSNTADTWMNPAHLTISKSKSAPTGFRNSAEESLLTLSDVAAPRKPLLQEIEQMIETDFLEAMPGD